MVKLCVCGGRDFTDVEYAVDKLNRLHERHPISHVISGLARGADRIGELWASEMGIPFTGYRADWDRHGKQAGPLRNIAMLEQGKPDIVLGLPGQRGTAHMLEIAREARVLVIAYEYLFFQSNRHPHWGFLSNFYHADQVDSDGIIYPTNEHFYQSRKTLSEKARAHICAAPTPGEAKRRGRAIVVRPDWETAKFEVMLEGLRMKFHQGSELSQKLLETDDLYLVEDTSGYSDRIWGVDKDRKGENWLGRLLMKRRGELSFE